MRIKNGLWLAVACVWMMLGAGCEDPPPPEDFGALILGIQTRLPDDPNPVLSGGMDETLDGFEALSATVVRVDVVHRSDPGDPATERVITIDSEERSFVLLEDLADTATRSLGFFEVPAGYVYQVRLVPSTVTIGLRGETHDVKIPSGMQSGLKAATRRWKSSPTDARGRVSSSSPSST